MKIRVKDSMRFEKKMLILNEITRGFSDTAAKGTLVLERTAYGISCTLNVFHLKDLERGEYLLGLTCGQQRTEIRHLGRFGKISAKFDISGSNDLNSRIKCVLAHVTGSSALPVLYGNSEKKHEWQANMLDGLIRREEYFEDAGRQDITEDLHSFERKEAAIQSPPAETAKKEEVAPLFYDILPPGYEDTAVAAENYYPDGYGHSVSEAGFTVGGAEKSANFSPFSKKRLMDSQSKPEIQNVSQERKAPLNSADYAIPPEKARPVRYYDRIKAQVDGLFVKFPQAEELTKMLPDTKWVKVDYDGSGKHYVIGLIGDGPSYVCYGVPAKYTKTQPPELDGYCQWFPLNFDKPEGDGYWLMYQDANTGESVEVELI